MIFMWLWAPTFGTGGSRVKPPLNTVDVEIESDLSPVGIHCERVAAAADDSAGLGSNPVHITLVDRSLLKIRGGYDSAAFLLLEPDGGRGLRVIIEPGNSDAIT